MSKWRLERPPMVKQEVGYKCWAAALESWCAVTPYRLNWTQDELLERRNLYVTPFDPTLPLDPSGYPQEGAINADVFKLMNKDIVLRLNMDYGEQPRGAQVDQDYFFNLLYENGYLFVVYTASSSGVRHANVIWAASSDGDVSTMDPMRGSYIQKVMEELRTPFLVAWASKEYLDPWA